MSDQFQLSAEIRQSAGTGANRRLRRLDKQIPAVVYGANKTPTSIMITQNLFENALKNKAFYTHILTLNVGKVTEKVVLKALQRHPSKPHILHADFQRVSATEKLHMTIPFHFINEEEAPGVKIDGGIISHLMNDVEIRCLPADLPEYIAVDVAELQLNESIHLSQLKVPKGVEIVPLMHEDDRIILNLHMPQIIEEPEIVEAPSAEVPLVGEEEGASASDAEKAPTEDNSEKNTDA